ncbi:ammonium transporter [Conexibacter sp. CPCC 206217]|uniref:ammonium transporter n=1 Tax=Conexibacter sp. CPCC 206217 TaxID=3064574 RepID=UPI00271BC305|nr:ammonium transporter [Conexibacter sp. CPCC 206217]MDO8209393.1 ammonium transporter [Conexibacter sp. CPCC 206217]
MTLLLPASALAQDGPTLDSLKSELDTTWVMVAACLVFFMQAGFAFLEIGLSRGKNAGMGIAKILINFSIGSLLWWAVGFGFAFGGDHTIIGSSGFFIGNGTDVAGTPADSAELGFFAFQLMFACVSLAIVWGSTLERIKFGVYIIFGAVFVGLIYPLVAHAAWSGSGILSRVGGGVQDFAGSSVVHLTGATAAFAALVFLGPRKGKFGPDGRPRAIPGHSMPLLGLGVLILWLGWFGFNGGSTLGTSGNSFAEVIAVTNMGAIGGVIGATFLIYMLSRKLDVGMMGNGAIAGLVAITAPAGYVEMWAAPIIGLVGGLVVVAGVLAIEKKLDDPVGALSAHGLAGIWGTLSCGLFTSDRLAESLGVGKAGLFYGGGLEQLGVQAVAVLVTFFGVFILSAITFGIIKATIGMRVSEEEEDAGLDIAEHGMYGYPEQFIPAPELIGVGSPRPQSGVAAPVGSTTEVTA